MRNYTAQAEEKSAPETKNEATLPLLLEDEEGCLRSPAERLCRGAGRIKRPVAADRSAANILRGGQWLPTLLGYIGIVFVMFSGVRRLDLRQNKSYGADPGYQAYVKSAPSFCRSSCSIAWQSADSLRHK